MTPKDENALMDEIDELQKARTRMLLKQINAQRPRQTAPYSRARLWQVGLLLFVVATALMIGLVRL